MAQLPGGVLVETSTETPYVPHPLVGLVVVARQIAARRGLLEARDHHVLNARVGECRKNLGAFEVELFLEAARTTDVRGALDRGDGEL